MIIKLTDIINNNIERVLEYNDDNHKIYFINGQNVGEKDTLELLDEINKRKVNPYETYFVTVGINIFDIADVLGEDNEDVDKIHDFLHRTKELTSEEEYYLMNNYFNKLLKII